MIGVFGWLKFALWSSAYRCGPGTERDNARLTMTAKSRLLGVLRTTVVLAVVGGMLAGCGVRGNLEAPPEAKADPTASATSGQGKAENAAPKPHRSFILDGLLR